MLNPALKLLILVILMSRNSRGSLKISSYEEAFRGSRLDRSFHNHILEKSVESASREWHRMAASRNIKSSKSKETAEFRDTSKSVEDSFSLSISFHDKAEESKSEQASKSKEASKSEEVSN